MFRFSPSWTKRQRSGGQTVAETPISSSYSMLGFRQINPEPRPPFKSNSCKTNLCFTLPDFGVQTKGVCTPSLRYAGPLSLTSTLLILDPECASAHQLISCRTGPGCLSITQRLPACHSLVHQLLLCINAAWDDDAQNSTQGSSWAAHSSRGEALRRQLSSRDSNRRPEPEIAMIV